MAIVVRWRAERTFSAGPQHLCQRLRTATPTVAFDPGQDGGSDKDARVVCSGERLQANEQAGALYDLSSDLGQHHNLYDQMPDKVQELSVMLDEIKSKEQAR